MVIVTLAGSVGGGNLAILSDGVTLKKEQGFRASNGQAAAKADQAVYSGRPVTGVMVKVVPVALWERLLEAAVFISPISCLLVTPILERLNLLRNGRSVALLAGLVMLPKVSVRPMPTSRGMARKQSNYSDLVVGPSKTVPAGCVVSLPPSQRVTGLREKQATPLATVSYFLMATLFGGQAGESGNVAFCLAFVVVAGLAGKVTRRRGRVPATASPLSIL